MTPFAVYINGMANATGPSTSGSLYVDGTAISYCSRNMATLELQLQFAISRLSL
jgi:hypothetical protein